MGEALIRKWAASDAAAYAGRLLRHGLLDKTNTAGGVWADTGYRSQKNEKFIARNGFASHVHRKKPKGKPMPEAVRRASPRGRPREQRVARDFKISLSISSVRR